MRPAHDYYIATRNGRYFDFLNPDQSVFEIEDIAVGICKEGRFNGQCDGFYSVGQHSIIGSEEMSTYALALEFLLHDASEAPMGDCVSPLKRLLRDYRTIENRFDVTIRKRFRLPLTMSPEVKAMDDIMYVTERRDLTPEFDIATGNRAQSIKPLGRIIRPYPSWQTCYDEYMKRFRHLTLKLGLNTAGAVEQDTGGALGGALPVVVRGDIGMAEA